VNTCQNIWRRIRALVKNTGLTEEYGFLLEKLQQGVTLRTFCEEYGFAFECLTMDEIGQVVKTRFWATIEPMAKYRFSNISLRFVGQDRSNQPLNFISAYKE
jgi:hypothetical protein